MRKKKTRQVLIIDNDLVFVNKLKNSIHMLGFEVTVSNSPGLAIEALQQAKYELVVADSSLPGISSKEFIQNLKKRDDQIPIFITSDSTDLDLKESVMLCGASDFFLKKFEFDRLLLKIYKLA